LFADEHRKGVTTGWGTIHERVRKAAEAHASFAAGGGKKQ
jgi:hypothetical protein